MKWRNLQFPLLSFLAIGIAVPIEIPAAAHSLQIVKTTTNSDGSVIDWVHRDSQVPDGKIATPPPLPVTSLSSTNDSSGSPWATLRTLNVAGLETPPEGTVPVLRSSISATNSNKTLLTKYPPVDPEHVPEFKAEAAGDHWYASTAQGVNNHGGSASFSMFKAWTESNADFSLLQTAVLRYNVPKPGDNSQLVSQSVEAGW
jgi:hypothetical protein